MIYATVEFPGGYQIHLGVDQRWTGDVEVIVDCANLNQPPYRIADDWPAHFAKHVASALGGNIVYVKHIKREIPPGAI